jgi:glycosyltransferase involved in cell wall biosynthesis
MNNMATGRPARIFTTWGTVLYVDVASRELRHGPIDTSPANAVFATDPNATNLRRQGRLMHDEGERLEPIACGALACRVVSGTSAGDGPIAPTLLDLVPLERGLIAFSEGGRFLCAQPDGRLDLANTWCSTWECFLASEDWCGEDAVTDTERGADTKGTIDRRGIAKFIVDARLRIKANATAKRTKILIFGYPAWSHGRLFYDLSKNLYKRSHIVDIINWQVNHAAYIVELLAYYDLVLCSLDGISILIDIYGVPPEQIIALSQHEMDMRILISQKGVEIFEKFAGYGVVGYQLYDASAIFGISRRPMVAQHGVAFSEFYAEVPTRLTTVGYASSFSQQTIYGVEIKRGEVAEAAARDAGLEFKMAGSGSTADQVSFHDMPDFYKTVDAVLITSVTEGAPLPVKEGAAAGRLVISTPVGDFPLRAYQGAGIIAPIEAEKYRKFTAETLRYYKDNPEVLAEKCRRIQEAARQFDWQHMIGDWVDLIEAAKGHLFKG